MILNEATWIVNVLNNLILFYLLLLRSMLVEYDLIFR